MIAAQTADAWAYGLIDAMPILPVAWARVDGFIAMAIADTLNEKDRRTLLATGKSIVTDNAAESSPDCPAITADTYGGALAAVGFPAKLDLHWSPVLLIQMCLLAGWLAHQDAFRIKSAWLSSRPLEFMLSKACSGLP